MKRKIIKISALSLTIIIALSAFMILKGLPMIAVSKFETALNNKDGVQLSQLCDNYINNRWHGLIGKWLTQPTYDAVIKYMSEWIEPVANDFNRRFSNYETQEEMDTYLKNEYNNIFFSNESDDEIIIYAGWGFKELYMLRESKISSIKAKKDLDEVEEKLNLVKDMLAKLPELSDETRENSVLTEKDAECLKIYTRLKEIDFYFSPSITMGCSQEDTLYNELNQRATQLQNEYNRLETELNKY